MTIDIDRWAKQDVLKRGQDTQWKPARRDLERGTLSFGRTALSPLERLGGYDLPVI